MLDRRSSLETILYYITVCSLQLHFIHPYHNRWLEIVNYFYGVNTMLLVFALLQHLRAKFSCRSLTTGIGSNAY